MLTFGDFLLLLFFSCSRVQGFLVKFKTKREIKKQTFLNNQCDRFD